MTLPEKTLTTAVRQVPTLELAGLTGGYGAKPVVKGVSLGTRSGITGLIGSNGAGKTTAIRLITGSLRPTNGSIKYDGVELAGRSPDAIVRLGVVLVPEGRGLFPSMSAEENLLMGAYLPRARHEQRESFDRVYGLFPRLYERRSVMAKRLSGGEQQMLAIGRALVALPRLLILDEPSLGLAPTVIEQVAKAISRIAADGVPILLCEQNAAMALFLSDYLYVMEHGQISLEGPPDQLRKKSEVARAYLGG